VILIHVSLLKEMSVGSVSVPCTKYRYQSAKFTVASQSVLWSPIPQLSYLDVNAAVSLNYMDVLMTHACSFAMRVKPVIFMEKSLSCHRFCLIFFFFCFCLSACCFTV